jgi:hypothetical protein
MFDDKICPQQEVHVFCAEPKIFVVKQHGNVRNNADNQQSFSYFWAADFEKKDIKQIVEQNAYNNNVKVFDVKVSVKPKGHPQQKKLRQIISFCLSEEIITAYCQR